MKRVHFHFKPQPVSEVLKVGSLGNTFDEGWRERAERLQARRWRALRKKEERTQSMEGFLYKKEVVR